MFSGWPVIEESDPEAHDTVFGWLVQLRWFAVLGVAGVLALAGPVFDTLPRGSAPWLWATVGALSAYNGALALLGPRRGWSWLTRFEGQIAVDCITLAGLVHLAGGLDNPFLPLFVLHVVTANIVLSGGAAAGVLALSLALLATIVVGEGTGVLAHHCLRRAAGTCRGAGLDLHSAAVLGGLVLTLGATSAFTRFLTARLRTGRRHLLAAVSELTIEKQHLAATRSGAEMERARLQAIIDCMGDAVSFLGPDGTLLFSNHRARELWRTGAPLAEVQALAASPTGAVEPGTPTGGTTFHRGGRCFELSRAVVRGARGTELGLVVVAHDITERLMMERHLMREEQLSVVGKLAAAVAHEINNPIGVVALYSQHAMAKLAPGAPVYQHLETIHRNADACRKIVENMLAMARPPKPERRRVDLRQLCREAVESLQPLAARSGVRISSRLSVSSVPIWAQVDAGMLRQAVLNLAVNAIEAARVGDEVSVGAYETQDRQGVARAIEVRDTGTGIAPEDVARIFQPFFTTKATGTGLGLSITDSIVKSHGGRIEVESSARKGTLFRIVLPARAAEDGPALPRLPHSEATWAEGAA